MHCADGGCQCRPLGGRPAAAGPLSRPEPGKNQTPRSWMLPWKVIWSSSGCCWTTRPTRTKQAAHDGSTALTLAAYGGHLEGAQLLLFCSAPIHPPRSSLAKIRKPSPFVPGIPLWQTASAPSRAGRPSRSQPPADCTPTPAGCSILAPLTLRLQPGRAHRCQRHPGQHAVAGIAGAV